MRANDKTTEHDDVEERRRAQRFYARTQPNKTGNQKQEHDTPRVPQSADTRDLDSGGEQGGDRQGAKGGLSPSIALKSNEVMAENGAPIYAHTSAQKDMMSSAKCSTVCTSVASRRLASAIPSCAA